MKAIVIEGQDLRYATDVPQPVAGPDQLLVRVRAVGVNYADLMRRPSHFGEAHGPAIAGLEFTGEVAGMGANVRGFKVGDRVMAMESNTYAEYATVDYRLACKVPDNLDRHQAAAVMVSFMTAHDALCTEGRFVPGTAVLINGCTTGVGIAAAQIARYLHASAVIGTSTSAVKLAQMKDWGVTHPVNVTEQSVVEVVNAATGKNGADVIVDNIGGAVAADTLAAAAIRARWITVGRVNGKFGNIELNEFARKRMFLIGTTFRTRTLFDRMEVLKGFATTVLPAIAAGVIKPKVDSVFELADAAAAQDHVKAGKHFGKVVLHVG